LGAGVSNRRDQGPGPRAGPPGRRGNLFLAQQALRRKLERQLRQPVDVLINPGRTTAFMR